MEGEVRVEINSPTDKWNTIATRWARALGRDTFKSRDWLPAVSEKVFDRMQEQLDFSAKDARRDCPEESCAAACDLQLIDADVSNDFLHEVSLEFICDGEGATEECIKLLGMAAFDAKSTLRRVDDKLNYQDYYARSAAQASRFL